MSQIRVTMFHSFGANYDGKPIECLKMIRVQELFCFLLLHRKHGHRREVLIETLWGEAMPKHAQKYLRQLLWQLRAGLSCCDLEQNESYLVTEGEWVSIQATPNILSDVEKFENAFALAQDVKGTELTDQQGQRLKDAVELYVGDLLDGWYQDWCVFERERLQNMYLLTLEKLMQYCKARGEYETGLEYGTRALRYDRAREVTYRRMMWLSFLIGDRTGALRYYDRCVEALKTELGVEPGSRTMLLRQQIGDDLPFEDWSVDRGTTPGYNEMLVSVIQSCQKLKRTLDHTQRQLQKNVIALEKEDI